MLPDAAGRVVGALVPVFVVGDALALLVGLVVLGLRGHRARGAERLQVMWLWWAVALFVVLNAQRIITTDGPILFLLTLPLIPGAATVAIVRYQLYDIRLIVNRSLVYGLLTLGVVGGYLAIIAGLSALADERLSAGQSLIATAAIAIAFAPAHSGLQELVDRLMYGQRRDPAAAAARVGVRLGGGLTDVLREVCVTLRLPYAAVSSDGSVLASFGRPPELVRTVALEVSDGPAADLLVGLRAGETRLSAADGRALDLLAAPIGVALQAVRLAEQVRESRARIVAAREEERRRLRRDLHDGLGTALTAVTLKADAAQLQSIDPQRSGQLLLDLRADLTAAIADIRRLVYDLRPPDLDELGLTGALRRRAEQSWRRPNASFVVTIDAPDPLPTLPAAVEVAAYRIATEAVTNTLRHSDASRCQVFLRVDHQLHLDIIDNHPGNCVPPTGWLPWRVGVGLRSMRERAAELGGSLTAGPTESGGSVHALLPLGRQ